MTRDVAQTLVGMIFVAILVFGNQPEKKGR